MNFSNDYFPTKRSYSKKNIKLHENSFLSEVGGGVQMEKKTLFVSPSGILKPQIWNHEGIYDLKNPRAENHEKVKNGELSSAELKKLQKNTAADVLCVRGLKIKP